MAEYGKRPEVTIAHMGKVHNPSGEGVAAISTKVQAKISKTKLAAAAAAAANGGGQEGGAGGGGGSGKDHHRDQHHNNQQQQQQHQHETKVGKEGTAKRNITRKKTNDKDTGNYNSCYKKQGGHGKGKWKADVIDPSYEEEIPIDEKDPIYDVAEDSTQYILTSCSSSGAAVVAAAAGTGVVGLVDPSSGEPHQRRGYDPGTDKAVYGPLLTLCEFKIQFTECLYEYFDSCDADEVIRTLDELGCQEYHPEIVKKAVSLAMDKGPRERELTSRLLSCLQPAPLTHAHMEAGFTILLDGLDELSKDVPDAKPMVASFLARAVVDDIISPAYLSEQNNSRPGDEVIEKAISLLSREHCNARLERVWGPGDGRPVEELKKDMDALLKEYLLSRELDEGARCVKELDAPHFHHELVKRGGVTAMEIDGKAAVTSCGDNAAAADAIENNLANIDAMAALFGFLTRNAIVSSNQINKGVDRLHKILPDITLDVPAAPKLLEAFKKCLVDQECLAASSMMTMDESKSNSAE